MKSSTRFCSAICARERAIERGDVERAVGVEHRERRDLAVGLVAERLVRAPEEARRQERLAGLEVVRDRVTERARPARRRRGDGARAHLGLVPEEVADDGGEKIGRAGDRRVRRPLLGGDLVNGARGGRKDREAAVVVEERADGRVDDRLAPRLARRRLLVEREDRIVGRPALMRRDDVKHASVVLPLVRRRVKQRSSVSSDLEPGRRWASVDRSPSRTSSALSTER